MSSKLLSTAQVAELLGLARETVCDYARDNIIPGCLIGRRWRFTQNAIDEFVETQRRGR